MITVAISNRQAGLVVNTARLRRAVRLVLAGEGVSAARICVAVVDDQEMAALHQRFSGVTGATDVLTFELESGPPRLEGDIVASADTAARAAVQYGWTAQEELLLYVVHGALHLAGYDDHSARQAQWMRRAERKYLAAMDVVQPALKAEAARRLGASRRKLVAAPKGRVSPPAGRSKHTPGKSRTR